LVSCEEAKSAPEPAGEARPEPTRASQEDSSSEDGQPKKSKWPVKTPSQYTVMVVVFAACVFIGYLIGR